MAFLERLSWPVLNAAEEAREIAAAAAVPPLSAAQWLAAGLAAWNAAVAASVAALTPAQVAALNNAANAPAAKGAALAAASLMRPANGAELPSAARAAVAIKVLSNYGAIVSPVMVAAAAAGEVSALQVLQTAVDSLEGRMPITAGSVFYAEGLVLQRVIERVIDADRGHAARAGAGAAAAAASPARYAARGAA